jgi:NAD(P)-dependent dehydrogenase (short-subunit alcohol dehydrogenase family)
MDLDLKGRVAFVTGAGSGIGEGIAQALAREGCAVYAADLNIAAAERVAADLMRTGHSVNPVAIDVADAAVVAKAFAAIGALDIVVNAAGLISMGPLADTAPEEFHRVARVNVEGIVNCAKAAIPAMAKARHGRIINIASVSAMRGGGAIGNTLYGASKAAVVALTMGLARELGPSAITVNAIAPALLDTAMTHAALTGEARQRIMARIPLGRFVEVADVADLVVFLASARAAFITGAVIPVDGGWLTV